MTFAELLNEITTAKTLAGARLAYTDALAASYNLYIDQIERSNDHATAERAYDRRNDDIYCAWLDRGEKAEPFCDHGRAACETCGYVHIPGQSCSAAVRDSGPELAA